MGLVVVEAHIETVALIIYRKHPVLVADKRKQGSQDIRGK